MIHVHNFALFSVRIASSLLLCALPRSLQGFARAYVCMQALSLVCFFCCNMFISWHIDIDWLLESLCSKVGWGLCLRGSAFQYFLLVIWTDTDTDKTWWASISRLHKTKKKIGDSKHVYSAESKAKKIKSLLLKRSAFALLVLKKNKCWVKKKTNSWFSWVWKLISLVG